MYLKPISYIDKIDIRKYMIHKFFLSTLLEFKNENYNMANVV